MIVYPFKTQKYYIEIIPFKTDLVGFGIVYYKNLKLISVKLVFIDIDFRKQY